METETKYYSAGQWLFPDFWDAVDITDKNKENDLVKARVVHYISWRREWWSCWVFASDKNGEEFNMGTIKI